MNPAGINCPAVTAIIRLAAEIGYPYRPRGITVANLWFFARLHSEARSSPVLPACVPRLAWHARRADDEACLFFSRADDAHGGSIDFWLDSSPRVRREAAELLRAGTGAGWRLWTDDGIARQVRHPHESGRDVADELAAVSSDFALATLSAGTSNLDAAFGQAVVHLRGIAAQLPADTRPGFLFQCWRKWSAWLPVKERVELAAGAGIRAAAVADQTSPDQTSPGETSAAQRAYLRGSREAISRQGHGGLPAPYLWFAQAGATHERLAIPAAVSAAAALTVRGELAPVPAGRPVMVSGGVR